MPRTWLGAGGCNFAVVPDLPANQSSVIWLPHLDPATVLVAPAPPEFIGACAVNALATAFERAAAEGRYRLIDGAIGRLPVALAAESSPDNPAAALIPFDAEFATRVHAALRLWHMMNGRSEPAPANRLTAQRRQRLVLTLRALDARLIGEPYRVIAQGLFGAPRVPKGASWKTHDLRDRTIRLVRSGFELMNGGYLDLLRYPSRRQT